MMKPSQVKDCQFPLKPSSSADKWYVFDLETNGLYDDVTQIFSSGLKTILHTDGLSPEEKIKVLTDTLVHNINQYNNKYELCRIHESGDF